MITARMFSARRIAVALALFAATAATDVVAQDYELVVALGENYGLDPTAFEDIAEETAYIVQDFGGFAVTRWYQLPPQTGTSIENCASNASCYVDRMFDSAYDYVLVVNAYNDGNEINVRYQTIDTRVGILATETEAFLPTVTDFPYLMAPCHDALKVTPDWIDPGPVVTIPEPVQAEIPTTPLPTYTFEEPERERMGQLGRIGAYTAGGGGALLVGGVLLGFGADETQQEIQAEPHSRERLSALQDKGRSQQTMANVFMIAGGAILATGVTLLIVDHLGGDDDASLAMGTSGSNLWLRAEF